MSDYYHYSMGQLIFDCSKASKASKKSRNGNGRRLPVEHEFNSGQAKFGKNLKQASVVLSKNTFTA